MSNDEKMKTKPPGGTIPRALREFYKTMRYLLAYAGEEETAWLTLMSTETSPGVLPYLMTKLSAVARIRDRWLEVEPEWEGAWAWMEQLYAQNAETNNGLGFMVGPLSGRRSGVLEDGKKQAVVNWPILETEAMIMRIVEQNVIALYPWLVDGPGTGVIAQIHDAVKLELSSRRDPKRVCAELNEAATVVIPGWDTSFKVEVHHGTHFGQLG